MTFKQKISLLAKIRILQEEIKDLEYNGNNYNAIKESTILNCTNLLFDKINRIKTTNK